MNVARTEREMLLFEIRYLIADIELMSLELANKKQELSDKLEELEVLYQFL